MLLLLLNVDSIQRHGRGRRNLQIRAQIHGLLMVPVVVGLLRRRRRRRRPQETRARGFLGLALHLRRYVTDAAVGKRAQIGVDVRRVRGAAVVSSSGRRLLWLLLLLNYFVHGRRLATVKVRIGQVGDLVLTLVARVNGRHGRWRMFRVVVRRRRDLGPFGKGNQSTRVVRRFRLAQQTRQAETLFAFSDDGVSHGLFRWR